MKKRISFTQRELDVIISMACIAGAGTGEGDYEPWTDEDWAAMNTLTVKAAELLRRKKGVDSDTPSFPPPNKQEPQL